MIPYATMKYPIDLLEFIRGSDNSRFRNFWREHGDKAKTLNFLEGLLRHFRTIESLQVLGLWKRVADSAHTVESPYGSQFDKTYFTWAYCPNLRIGGRYTRPEFWDSVSKLFHEIKYCNLRDCYSEIYDIILKSEPVLERIVESVAIYHHGVPRPIGKYMGNTILADIRRGKIIDCVEKDDGKDGPCAQCANAAPTPPERFYYLDVYITDDISLYLQGPSEEYDEQLKYIEALKEIGFEEKSYIKSLEKKLRKLRKK